MAAIGEKKPQEDDDPCADFFYTRRQTLEEQMADVFTNHAVHLAKRGRALRTAERRAAATRVVAKTVVAAALHLALGAPC